MAQALQLQPRNQTNTWRVMIMVWAVTLILVAAGLNSPAWAQGPGTGSSLAERFRPAGSAARTPEAAQVQADLIADVAAIEPGRPFRLGVRYRVAPGWHIYWRNSGDVGFATKIEWQLPAGFTASELQWPLPERIEEAGLISYGYHGQVLLFATITPPPTLPAASGSLHFGAQTDWVACKEKCIPGQATVSLDLPAATQGAQASPQAAFFAEVAARLPQAPSAESNQRVTFNLEPDRVSSRQDQTQPVKLTIRTNAPWQIITDAATTATTATAAVNVPGAELFPAVPDSWEAAHPTRGTFTPEQGTFEWTLTPRLPDAPTTGLAAVLRLPLMNPATGQRRVEHFILPIAVDRATSPTAASSPSAGQKPEPDSKPTAGATGAGAKDLSATANSNQGLSFLNGAAAPAQPAKPLWRLLILAFLGGLILNVMPCVLPVISLKVLGFVRQAGESRARVAALGLTFGAGVLASFAVLAIALIMVKTAGSHAGWGFTFQEPRFVIIMAGVVLAFALSLLGVYTLELPGAAAGSLDTAVRREGHGGAFLSGLLATVLATPCMAPLLGGVLPFALTQPALLLILFFLTIGLGLATPYLALTAHPAWLKHLPKPGPWMTLFEQIMGFCLLGTMVWLLAIVGHQLGAEGMTVTLAFLLLVAVACWLLGVGRTPRAGRGRRRASLILAIALVVAGFFYFPERSLRKETMGLAAAGSPASPSAGIWEPFSPARVEALARQGRTVFVDFTAAWCLTCKVNERLVLETDAVREAFARHQVATLKADWTRRDETIGRVIEQLGGSGVPLYVIFPAGQPEKPIVLPTVLTPGVIEEQLKAATSMARLPHSNSPNQLSSAKSIH